MLIQIAKISAQRLKIADSRDNRDELMAKNMEWLLNVRYPGKKVIVWAHNSHIGYQDIPFRENLVRKSMAAYLKPEFAEQMYSIGMYMGQGSTNMWGMKDTPVLKPLPNSLEELFLELEMPYVFLDLKALDPSQEPGATFNRSMPSYWWGGPEVDRFPISHQHDGLIFLDRVKPSTGLK